MSLDAKLPAVVSGFQFGATVEVGKDCFYPKDFGNDVSVSLQKHKMFAFNLFG